MQITHKIKLDLSQQGATPRISVVQGDAFSRSLAIWLFENRHPWKVPAGATVLVRYRKPNGATGVYDTLPDGTGAVSASGHCIRVLLAPEALTHPGLVQVMVTILAGSRQISTFALELAVQPLLSGSENAEGTAWVAAFLPIPETAAPGQIFAADKVDAHGKVISVAAMDPPEDIRSEIPEIVDQRIAALNLSDGADGISVTHAWDGTVLTVTSASGTSSADLKGTDGKSAYAYATDAGFKGSEADFARRMAAGYVQTVNGAAPDAAGNVSLDTAALPVVSTENEGAFLRVVNGVWSVAVMPQAEGVGF